MTTSLSTIGGQAQAMRFNAACPAPQYVVPPDSSWLVHYPGAAKYRKLFKTMLDFYPDAVERWDDLSLPEHEREAARQQHVANRQAVEEASAEVEDWRQKNVERVSVKRSEDRAKMIPEALALLDTLEGMLQEDATAHRIVASFRNDHRAKRDVAVNVGHCKIAGGESLSNLRRGIESFIAKPVKEEVTPLEFHQRRERGEDVSNLKINHSKAGWFPRGSYE